MTKAKPDVVMLLADGLALVYHEARHVRHLVRAGYVVPAGWKRLLSLPTNRVEAWRALQDVRKAATAAETAERATSLFEERFAKSLADLQDLYVNEHWKHAATIGGHAWRHVTGAVMALRDAVERGDRRETEVAVWSLLTARHNNGSVRDKITGLDAAIQVEPGPWWQQQPDV